MRSLRQRSGQLLIVAIVLLVILVLSIPLIVSTQLRVQRFFVDSSSRRKADYTSQAAFARIAYTFETNSAIWQRALAGDELADVGFNGSQTFDGPHGISYTVKCVREGDSLSGRVRATVQIVSQGQSTAKSRVYQSILSQKTMGVAVSEAVFAPAALYVRGDIDLHKTDLKAPELDVHWGAVVSFSTIRLSGDVNEATWGRHPRKLAKMKLELGPGAPVEGATDNSGYWVGPVVGDPVEIDDAKYMELAKAFDRDVGNDPEKMPSGGYVPKGAEAVSLRGQIGVGDGKKLPVLYIDRNLFLQTKVMDLDKGAMIVGDNLVIGDHGEGAALSLRVPVLASREYPYLPSGSSFPCQEHRGSLCTADEALGSGGRIDFRGFLYVKGDLYIQQNTVISGVVRVEGQLHIAPGKRLTIFFDDQVSRTILTTKPQIQQQVVSEVAS